MTTFAILYLRPDGWWVAGSGFPDREKAEDAAKSQLPDHVHWQVVGESTDLFEMSCDQNYEGLSHHVCRVDDDPDTGEPGGWVACPPSFCEADALLKMTPTAIYESPVWDERPEGTWSAQDAVRWCKWVTSRLPNEAYRWHFDTREIQALELLGSLEIIEEDEE